MPEILHPQDAIVRVTCARIRGSDRHLYRGLVPDTRVGSTFGHEFVGIIEEMAPDVTKVKVGGAGAVQHRLRRVRVLQAEIYGNATDRTWRPRPWGPFYGYSHTAGGYTAAKPSTCACPTPTWAPR